MLGPGDAAAGSDAGMRVDDVQRRRRPRRDLAGGEIDDDDLRRAEAVADGDGVRGVDRIGVLDVGEMRDPFVAPGRRRPAEEIAVEEAFVVRLLVRIENGRAIACPARVLDITALGWPKRVQRLARRRLRANGRNVVRIASQHFGDALITLGILFVRTGRVDDELRLPFFGAQHHRQLFAIRRDSRIAAAAGGLLPQLTVRPVTRARHGHGVLRQLGGKAAVEPPRRIAEDAGEGVVEASALAGGHARPEVTQRIGAVLLNQPFEERGTSEIGHRQAEETVVGVELPVRRELAVHRPRAEDGRTHGTGRPAAAGDAAFDQRRVTLQHPARRVARDRIERNDVRQGALERIARRAKQMDEVGGLVDGQQVDPGRVLADLILRLGRLGEEEDARRVEEGDGDAVRFRVRILDEHVGDCLRGEPDLRDHRRPHRFDPLRDPRGPRLVPDRIVNAEVRRDDRPPWLMRRLGVNRRCEQQREKGETADHDGYVVSRRDYLTTWKLRNGHSARSPFVDKFCQ